MLNAVASATLPLLRRLDPERAHNLALLGLRLGLAGRDAGRDDAALAIDAFGRRFRNPIGLAAGFDKNAVALRQLRLLGFGFIEVGTVTPRPQSGNPRPRLFRLERDGAVINRYGMNNQGIDAFVARLAAVPRGPVLVGANVGVNKDGARPEQDLPALLAAVSPFADYVVINVSSPNTPGLRDLQTEARLGAILSAVRDSARDSARDLPPLLIKIAPDQNPGGLEALIQTAILHRVDGLIVSNTTVERPESLRSPHARQAGGLSGRPLFGPSTAMLRQAHRLAAGRLTLVGCGGVASGRDVLAKIRAGARLVQLYSAFAYQGPALIPRLKAELRQAMQEQGFRRLADAVGVDA